MDLTPYRAFLIELAVKSGDFLRPLSADPALAVEIKSDDSPVTAADRGAEQLMRDLITARFPEHGILGEEFPPVNEGAEWTWVLDPIDGTKSFITGVPLWTTLIALQHRGQPVLGAIHQPVLGQLLIGDNITTTLNGVPVRLRECAQLDRATVLTSDPLNPAKYQDGAAWETLASRARLVRTWGDGYGYLLLASGRADLMCDPIMNPWDIQALIPVIRGAGGVITDWQGGDPVNGQSILAAGAELHAQARALLTP